MLTSLHVRNFALIDHLELDFGPGLNLLTGETGAGKSIVIDALGLSLGERASSEMIRNGTDRLSVEAVFSLGDAPPTTCERLKENSLENEDDPEVLIISREVNKAGKSTCRINGRLVPTSLLRSIAQDLVDVHGQHEHQSLLLSDTHIHLLDNWLGADVIALRRKVSEFSTQLSETGRALDKLQSEARERARNLDLYRFQQKEISDAGLKEDEETDLVAERTRLANLEKLIGASEDAYQTLGTGAMSSISAALATLSRLSGIDPSLGPTILQLTESSAYLEESLTLLRRYKDTLESEPGRLDVINERLDLIHALERKYGDTVADVIEYGKSLSDKVFGLEDSEAVEADLRTKCAKIEQLLNETANALSERRTSGGKEFSEAIVTELLDLGMNQSAFETSIKSQPVTALGIDKVEFLISTNPGEPLRPLAKVASGGETSRLMLAIKSVLARSSYVPTMIFDEIDTGIGGRTGRVIADKLASLSAIAQILCITHLPQIASRPATAHFSIEKSVSSGRTTITVVPLSGPEREIEIARMLGGENSDTVLQHAREMLSAR